MAQESGLLPGTFAAHLAAEHLNGAALKRRETAQNAQQCGFARPIAAEQRAAPAWFQRELYFPKCREVSIELPDIGERDDGHGVYWPISILRGRAKNDIESVTRARECQMPAQSAQPSSDKPAASPLRSAARRWCRFQPSRHLRASYPSPAR